MPEAPLSLTPSPALDALMARASVPPRLLQSPAPGPDVLSRAVSAGLRAPDHGGLKPQRFVFITGDARVTLGNLLADSLARRDPEVPPARLEVERGKPLRAPLMVALGAAIRHDRPGVPPWEQEATTAAAGMNFLNAIDAQGFGAFWASSGALRDPVVKQALGFAERDSLLGWIYVGTVGTERPRPVPPAAEGFFRHWVP